MARKLGFIPVSQACKSGLCLCKALASSCLAGPCPSLLSLHVEIADFVLFLFR